MSEITGLEAETTRETTTFDHFDRTWTVPTQRHHSHLRQIKEIRRTEGSVDADDIARVFLEADDYAALLELDVDEAALNDFADHLARTMGIGGRGNSTSSSTSS